MATVSITVPDALVPRLKAAMRGTFPEHNALTDGKAFKAVTADYWRQILVDYEKLVAEQAYLNQQLAVEQAVLIERQKVLKKAHDKAISDADGIV